ncbi:MAG TPA: helix-turn-helix domain-containing protein [Acidobacteriota bacterium]|nr:helix-turn-helix domain-containing protein [Acidobacteriota bacterium]
MEEGELKMPESVSPSAGSTGGRLSPRRADRARRRRERILDAATEEIAAVGYQRATVRAIARRAGVADGTIYNYFSDKSDLLLGLLGRLTEAERRKIDLGRRPAASFSDLLSAYLRHRLDTLWQRLELLRATWPELLIDPQHRQRYYEQVVLPATELGETLLGDLAARGSVQTTDPALAARVVTASILGLALQRLLGDVAVDERRDELPEILTTVLLDGLRPRSCAR